MAIKETPTNFRVYYKSMRDTVTQRRKEALEAIVELEEAVADKHETVSNNHESYKNDFGVKLDNYVEYLNNRYINGEFLRMAKGAYLNRKGGHTLVGALFELYDLALKQKQLYDLHKDVLLYDNMLALNVKQYCHILDTFYSEVHHKLITEGAGYAFEGELGWMCINRCHLVKPRRHIDYAATKKRKAELKAEGKKLYNKEEAEWCKQRGIDYDGVDGRVIQKVEYVYEIPLLASKLPGGTKLKLEISDRRSSACRGKTNEQLLEECHNNVEEICKLPVDLRTKLNLSLQADKKLYTKFIRNETQEPINPRAFNRKDRQ